MEAWIFIAIAAAAFQTLRFMLQKQLSMGVPGMGTGLEVKVLYGASW